jgi:hypothetical protein
MNSLRSAWTPFLPAYPSLDPGEARLRRSDRPSLLHRAILSIGLVQSIGQARPAMNQYDLQARTDRLLTNLTRSCRLAPIASAVELSSSAGRFSLFTQKVG